MDKKRGFIIILIISLVAVFTSAYLLYLHYSNTSSFCDIGENISCDIVNRSIYSEVFGVPVALLSLIVFYFTSISSIAALQNKGIFGLNQKNIIDVIFWLMIASSLFALYLIYIEAFVLYTFCPLCLLLDILILIVLITIIKLRNTKID